MQKSQLPLPLMAVVTLIVTLGISSWVSPGTIVPLQQATPTNMPIQMPPPGNDGGILIDLPEDATQLEYGTEVYRLICKACHGDKGQGLTDDWRAQWAPEDQNCWQSKCHALNHPPDGFYMPKAPAVLGQPVKNFGTALNLYTYIHNFMPWHNRGSMTEKESWSATAYILTINGIDPGPDLNAETAAKIDLSVIDVAAEPAPTSSSSETQPVTIPENTPAPAPTLGGETQASPTSLNKTLLIIGITLAVIVLLVVILIRRRTDSSSIE